MADQPADDVNLADLARHPPPDDPAPPVQRWWHPTRDALRVNVALFWFAGISFGVCGVVPLLWRGFLVWRPPAEPTSFLGKFGLDALRGWEYCLLFGVLPLAYNSIWFHVEGGRRPVAAQDWVPFLLRQSAEYFMWSIILSTFASLAYHGFYDQIHV